MTERDVAQPQTSNELDLLLQVEAESESRLARAREEAKRIVAKAREQAAADEQTLDARFQTDLEKTRVALEEECNRKIASLRESNARACARLHDVDDATMERLVQYVCDRLLSPS